MAAPDDPLNYPRSTLASEDTATLGSVAWLRPPLTPLCPAPGSRRLRVRPRLIDEDQPLGATKNCASSQTRHRLSTLSRSYSLARPDFFFASPGDAEEASQRYHRPRAAEAGKLGRQLARRDVGSSIENAKDRLAMGLSVVGPAVAITGRGTTQTVLEPCTIRGPAGTRGLVGEPRPEKALTRRRFQLDRSILASGDNATTGTVGWVPEVSS